MSKQLVNLDEIFMGKDISGHLFNDREFASSFFANGRLEFALSAERSLLLAFKRKQEKVEKFFAEFQSEFGKYNQPFSATSGDIELPPQGMAYAFVKAMHIRASEYRKLEEKYGHEKCCLCALALSMPTDNFGAILFLAAIMFSRKQSKVSVSNRVRSKNPRPMKCAGKAYLITLLGNPDYSKEFKTAKEIMCICSKITNDYFEFNGKHSSIEFSETEDGISWTVTEIDSGKEHKDKKTTEQFEDLISQIRTNK